MLKHSCGTEIFFNYFMLMEFHKLNSATIAKLKYMLSCFHGPHSKLNSRIHKQTLCPRRLFKQKVQDIMRAGILWNGMPEGGGTAARRHGSAYFMKRPLVGRSASSRRPQGPHKHPTCVKPTCGAFTQPCLKTCFKRPFIVF